MIPILIPIVIDPLNHNLIHNVIQIVSRPDSELKPVKYLVPILIPIGLIHTVIYSAILIVIHSWSNIVNLIENIFQVKNC